LLQLKNTINTADKKSPTENVGNPAEAHEGIRYQATDEKEWVDETTSEDETRTTRQRKARGKLHR
jgi:hypothetical protein